MKLRFIALGLLTLAWIGTAQPIIRNQVTTNAFANGSNGQFLSLSGGVPVWAVPAGSAGTTNYFDTTIITNNFFVSGKGNTLVITQALTLQSMTANRVLKMHSSGNIVTNSGISDNGNDLVSIPNTYAQLRIPDGAAANPGLAFTVQTNNGIARIADGALSVVTGGAERTRIDSSAAAFLVPIQGSTGSGLSKTNIVRTDGNTNLAHVTIGSGLSFDGTTLSSSGGGGLTEAVTTLTYTTTNAVGFDCSTNGASYFLLLTNHVLFGSSTFSSLPAKTAYRTFTLCLQQDSTGGYVPKFTNSIVAWADGVQPVIKTNANAVSYIYLHTSLATNSMLVGTPNIGIQ